MDAELFLTDTQTDMMKLTVAFRNFVNAPNKGPRSAYWAIIFQTLGFRNGVAKIQNDKSVGKWFPTIRGKVVVSFVMGRPLNMRILCSIETSEIDYPMTRLQTLQEPMCHTGSPTMCRIIDNKKQILFCTYKSICLQKNI